MTRVELLSRISIDPEICFGKPRIRGHRIWVSGVLDLLSSGWTVARHRERAGQPAPGSVRIGLIP